jgi:hypothetical protein
MELGHRGHQRLRDREAVEVQAIRVQMSFQFSSQPCTVYLIRRSLRFTEVHPRLTWKLIGTQGEAS